MGLLPEEPTTRLEGWRGEGLEAELTATANDLDNHDYVMKPP